MTTPTMESTIAALLANRKGILAADESYPTIKKRFAPIDLASTEKSRRSYREMLFTTPGLNEFISGVILFDETLRQKIKDGVLMLETLAKQGIIPDIKADMGAAAFAHFADEKITQGLDGLRDRFIVYRELGARFTKWLAVIGIGEHIPTRTCIETNAEALARPLSIIVPSAMVSRLKASILNRWKARIHRTSENEVSLG